MIDFDSQTCKGVRDLDDRCWNMLHQPVWGLVNHLTFITHCAADYSCIYLEGDTFYYGEKSYTPPEEKMALFLKRAPPGEWLNTRPHPDLVKGLEALG